MYMETQLVKINFKTFLSLLQGTDSQNPNGLNADGSEVGDGSLTRAKHAEFGNIDAVERNFRKELELKSRGNLQNNYEQQLLN